MQFKLKNNICNYHREIYLFHLVGMETEKEDKTWNPDRKLIISFFSWLESERQILPFEV